MQKKISVSKFTSLSPKILELKSLDFNFAILQLYRKYLHTALQQDIVNRKWICKL